MILGVNVDHVATIRNARGGAEPDPVMAATLAVLGGADGITVHLREDRRHIKDRDLDMLKGFVPVELNLEMAATKEMVRIASSRKPDMVTIVPERREELTTEGGLAVVKCGKQLKSAIRTLKENGMKVSLFINPAKNDIEASAEIGADMVEIHTGYYSNAKSDDRLRELARVADAVRWTLECGMTPNAGHGLNYFNTADIASIDGIRGLYIGHSIISRAVLVGLENAVCEMKAIMESAC